MNSFFLKSSTETISEVKTNLSLAKSELEGNSDFNRNFGKIDLLVPNYIIPYAQNLNPADTIEMDTGLIAKNDAFSLLNRFLASDSRYSHAFILSDAGMGKTSLLTMVKIASILNLTSEIYSVKLYKLGADTITKIDQLSDPNNTVLLLDALDEDSLAWNNFYTRTQQILQKTKPFRKVIITCRTQFFPQTHEEDGKAPGEISLNGFRCSKLFLSPFDDNQVQAYLKSKFQDHNEISKASKIVSQMKSLRFRPMLLSYIDLLLESRVNYNYAYEIYEDLVDEWLNRELRKGVVKRKQPLINACKIIAFKMYKNNKSRYIEEHQIWDLIKEVDDMKDLPHLTVEGRSLLNITSDRKYKFAHFSIQEFFVAQKILNWTPRKFVQNTDQVIYFIGDYLSTKKLDNKNLNKLDLENIKIENSNLSSHSFDSSHLKSAILIASNFTSCSFKKANLSQSKIHDCIFIKAKFIDSTLNNCHFEKSDFTRTTFRNLNEKGLRFNNSKFKKTRIESCKIHASNFDNSTFDELTLTGNSELCDNQFHDSTFFRIEMTELVFQSNSFLDSKFSFCDFLSASMQLSSFRTAKLTRCSFRKASLITSVFSGAKLSNVIFENCNLKGSEFAGTELHTVSIRNCLFENSTFNHSKFDDCQFDTVEMKSIDSSKVTISKSVIKEWIIISSHITIDSSNSNITNSTFISNPKNNLSFSYTCNQSEFKYNRIINYLITTMIIKNESCVNNLEIESCNLQNIEIVDSEIYSLHLKETTTIIQLAIDNSNIENCIFENANIDKLEIKNSTLKNCSFRSAKINFMHLSNVEFIDCSFSYAILNEVDFSNTNLQTLNLSNITYSIKTKWPSETNFKELKGYGPFADHSNNNSILHDLSHMDLQKSNFSNIRTSNLNCQKTNFHKANLSNSNFHESDFNGSNLSMANLKSTTFYQCDLGNSNLNKANLSHANLSHSNLCGADLRRIFIQNTMFRKAKYDKKTLLPNKFDPNRFEMVFVKNS